MSTAFDLVDSPDYTDGHLGTLSVSTDNAWRKDKRLATLKAHWGVYYHGRLLHGGLHRSEVENVRDWYASGVQASDPRWQLLTTPGKQPSPSTDHRRKAGLEPTPTHPPTRRTK